MTGVTGSPFSHTFRSPLLVAVLPKRRNPIRGFGGSALEADHGSRPWHAEGQASQGLKDCGACASKWAVGCCYYAILCPNTLEIKGCLAALWFKLSSGKLQFCGSIFRSVWSTDSQTQTWALGHSVVMTFLCVLHEIFLGSQAAGQNH